MAVVTEDLDDEPGEFTEDRENIFMAAFEAFHRMYHGCDDSCRQLPYLYLVSPWMAADGMRIISEETTIRTQILTREPDPEAFLLSLAGVIFHPAFAIFTHELLDSLGATSDLQSGDELYGVREDERVLEQAASSRSDTASVMYSLLDLPGSDIVN